jgi:hypothetical protein
MDFLVLGVEGVSSERVEVFPADQPSDEAGRRIDYAEPRAIASRPDDALGVRWRQLAVQVERVPVGSDREKGVVQGSVRVVGSLVELDGDCNARVAHRPPEWRDVIAGPAVVVKHRALA